MSDRVLSLFLIAWSPIILFSQEPQRVKTLADVPYKTDASSDYEKERCVLDFYLPENRGRFATIVWFHGGGLQGGNKATNIAVDFATKFAKSGVAVASVNYRLSPRVQYPAYVQDAAAAVAFVRREIEQHGGSSRRVYVSGHSAGGYLTAMVGLDPKYLEPYGLRPSDLAGYIPISGQMVTHSTVRKERGIERAQPIIDEAAPLFHVQTKTSRFLCIVGSDDLPARAEENMYFVSAMKAAEKQSVRCLSFAGRDHGTIASRIAEPRDAVAGAILEMVSPRALPDKKQGVTRSGR